MPPHPFELFVPYTTTEHLMRDPSVPRRTLPPPPVSDTTEPSPPPASASASAAAFLSPPQRFGTRVRKKRIPLYQLRASGSSKMTRVTKPFIHYKQYSETFYTLWHSSREFPADRDERAEPAHPGGKENGAASPHILALPRSPAPLFRAHEDQRYNMITSASSTPCTSYSSSLTSCTSSSPSAAGSTASRSRSVSNESNFSRFEWQDTDARAFDTSLGSHKRSKSPMTPLSSTSSSSLSSLSTSIEGGSEEEDEEENEEEHEVHEEENAEKDEEEDEEEDERLDQFTNFVLGGLRAIQYEDISKRARTVASLKRKRGGFLVGVEVALS